MSGSCSDTGAREPHACTTTAAMFAEWEERGGMRFGPPPIPGIPPCADDACPVHGVIAQGVNELIERYGANGARFKLLATVERIAGEEEHKQRVKNAQHALRYRTLAAGVGVPPQTTDLVSAPAKERQDARELLTECWEAIAYSRQPDDARAVTENRLLERVENWLRAAEGRSPKPGEPGSVFSGELPPPEDVERAAVLARERGWKNIPAGVGEARPAEPPPGDGGFKMSSPSAGLPNQGRPYENDLRGLKAAARMEDALIDIGAILVLSADPATLLERIRQRVAQGLNHCPAGGGACDCLDVGTGICEVEQVGAPAEEQPDARGQGDSPGVAAIRTAWRENVAELTETYAAECGRLREQLDAARQLADALERESQESLARWGVPMSVSPYVVAKRLRAALGVGDSRPDSSLGGALDQSAVETRGGEPK